MLGCPERIGIGARVAGVLAAHGLTMIESSQYRDNSADPLFFMRVVVEATEGGASDVAAIRGAFAPIGREFGMDREIHARASRMRVLAEHRVTGKGAHTIVFD